MTSTVSDQYRVFVTGANQGLGYHICRLLAKHWYTSSGKATTSTSEKEEAWRSRLCIIMACRNLEAAEKAIKEIRSELNLLDDDKAPSSAVVTFSPVIQLDLGEQSFDPAAVVAQYDKLFLSSSSAAGSDGGGYLDVLIHNAAICDSFAIDFSKGQRCTADGVSQVLRVNFENTVKLNEAFLPVLRRPRAAGAAIPSVPSAARIIFMGSRLGVWNYLPEEAKAPPTSTTPAAAGVEETTSSMRNWFEETVPTLDQIRQVESSFKEAIRERNSIDQESPPVEVAVQKDGSGGGEENEEGPTTKVSVQSDNHKKDQWPEQVSGYGISKLFLHAYARRGAKNEEQKEMEKRRTEQRGEEGSATRSILWLPCTPGFCKTSMTGGNGFKTAEEGADTPYWLAATPDSQLITENITSGNFYGDRVPIRFDNGEKQT